MLGASLSIIESVIRVAFFLFVVFRSAYVVTSFPLGNFDLFPLVYGP